MTAKKAEKFEVKDKEIEMNDTPQLWICNDVCQCSTDPDNPNSKERQELFKMFRIGDEIFSMNRPSKHFVTEAEYKVGGSEEKIELLKQLQGMGVKVTEGLRKHDVKALTEYVNVTRRAKRLAANAKQREADMGRYQA